MRTQAFDTGVQKQRQKGFCKSKRSLVNMASSGSAGHPASR